MIYLDWASTTPPYKDAIDVLVNTLETNYGNPSSSHSLGIKAKTHLEENRQKCANMINCQKNNIIFTSGGTESNNMLIYSFLKSRDKGEIIVSSLEHPAALLPVNNMEKFGHKIKYLNPDKYGQINPEKLRKAINKNTRLIVIMLLNNEIGVIQPLDELIQVTRECEKEYQRKIHFHSDMVQALGKVPIDLNHTNIDSASFSAHKFGGPKGTGILYLKESKEFLTLGGGQERNLRPGTENIAAIASMVKALELTLNSNNNRSGVLMDAIMGGISNIANVQIIPNERMQKREIYTDYIISLSFPPIPGEVLARVLNDKGVAISTGSACSNNKKNKTTAITLMGYDRSIAFSSIRVSIGRDTTLDMIDRFISILKESINELKI